MAHPSSTGRGHCYTNPTFCTQSELDSRMIDDLPPPPQFQEDLPPPSPSPPPPPPLPHTQNHQQVELQNRSHYNDGHVNSAFQCTSIQSKEINVPRPVDRYGFLDERRPACPLPEQQDNYAVQMNERRRIIQNREIRSRYEYIVDEDDNDEDRIVVCNDNRARTPENLLRNTSRTGSARYGFIDCNTGVQQIQQIQQVQQVPAVFTYQREGNRSLRDSSRYALVPINSADEEILGKEQWISPGRTTPLVLSQRSNSTRGRYARVPSEELLDPPSLPERNIRDQQTMHPDEIICVSPKNNLATQKLHEILTTPRKPRSKSEERTLSPGKRQQQHPGSGQRGAITPTGSPSGRLISSPSRGAGTPSRRDQLQLVQATTPHRGDSSPSNGGGPHTSTPNKEQPSARRCLPLNLDNSTSSRIMRDTRDSSCPASNCGRVRYPQQQKQQQQRGSAGQGNYGIVGSPMEPPPRYAYLDGLSESIPMVSGSPRYQVVRANYEKSVESAFIARTAVVPPLSPPNSEANTTITSGLEKNDRRNAPLLLLLVGILTCGLALYLTWSQGRRYYLDSAAGCGACCALAGACRSLRRTWTGLGLAGLSALSCAGLLLIAAKNPRPGTALHDITAGALCGVSLLGASLALLALVSPKCKFARHRRVHSWIPGFSTPSSGSYQ